MGKNKKSPDNQMGFTLLELSIVLVIIGLIVGGIMVGRTLIRAAEIKSIGTDIEKFESARMTFRDKYNCIAGDCAQASNLGLGTNGNGNGYAEHYLSAGEEPWYFWQHLSRAGLISGNYSGQDGPAANEVDAVAGVNVPSAKIPNVGYSIYTAAPQWSVWSPTLDGYGLARPTTDTMYMIGGDNSPNNYNTTDAFLSPVDAKSLDDKYDDGLANNGKIRTAIGHANYNSVGCTSGAQPNYSYTNSSVARCNLQYWFRNF